MLLLTREFRLLRASRPYWITLILLGLLTALAFQIGWARAVQAAERHRRYQLEQAELHMLVREAVAEQSTKDGPAEVRRGMMPDPSVDLEQLFRRPLNPIEKGRFRVLWNFAKGRFSIVHLPWRTWKPPAPLAAVSIGESEHWPSYYQLDRTRQGTTLAPPQLSNPFLAMIGGLDLSTLVTVVLPLIVIVVLHDFVSSDREQGTLKLILSQDVSFRRLALTRLLLRSSGVVLTVLFVIGGSCLFASIDVSQERTAWLLGAFSLSVVIYVAFWSAIAWLVNSLGLSSVANGMLLTLCWVMLVIAAPWGVSRFVAERYQVTPLSALAAREREVQRSLPTDWPRPKDGARRTEQDRQNLYAWERNRQDRARAGMSAAIDATLARHRARSSALDASVVWSPALAMKGIFDFISGNSLTQVIAFTDRTSDFHAEFLAYFGNLPDLRWTLSVQEIQEMPVFKPLPSGHDSLWPQLRRGLLALVIWSAVPFVLGWIGFHSRFQRA